MPSVIIDWIVKGGEIPPIGIGVFLEVVALHDLAIRLLFDLYPGGLLLYRFDHRELRVAAGQPQHED
jgi:hypothetical protein